MNRASVNPAALAVKLRTDGGAQAALDMTADALKSKAESYTPSHTGYARRRYRVDKRPVSRRLTNTDWFFHLIEWGSVNNPVYAPMRKAARALGLKFKEADR